MDLSDWLVNLAAGFNFELKPCLVKQYLKTLANWKLTPAQWEDLNTRALLRNDYFPRISELYQIACELTQEAQIRSNSKSARAIWTQGECFPNAQQGKPDSR